MCHPKDCLVWKWTPDDLACLWSLPSSRDLCQNWLGRQLAVFGWFARICIKFFSWTILLLLWLPQIILESLLICGWYFSLWDFDENVTLYLQAWDWTPQQSWALWVRLNLLSSQLGWALVPVGEGCLFRLSLHWGQRGHASLSSFLYLLTFALLSYTCSQLIVWQTTFSSSVQKMYSLCQHIQRVVWSLYSSARVGGATVGVPVPLIASLTPDTQTLLQSPLSIHVMYFIQTFKIAPPQHNHQEQNFSQP